MRLALVEIDLHNVAFKEIHAKDTLNRFMLETCLNLVRSRPATGPYQLGTGSLPQVGRRCLEELDLFLAAWAVGGDSA